MKKIVVVLFLLVASRLNAGAIENAHDAFLNGQFKEMAIEMKDTLLNSNDQTVKENVFSLLRVAYEQNKGKAIPVDWKLPNGVEYASISVANRLSRYKLSVAVGVKKGFSLEQVQIIQYSSNQTLLDKQGGIGELEPSDDEGRSEWYLATDYENIPPEEGLYFINIKLKGEPVVNGWVILSEMNSQENPEVVVPAKDQSFNISNPVFSWKDFYSSKYDKKVESRGISIFICAKDADQTDLWTSSFEEPKLPTEVTVGNYPKTKLSPGDYYFKLSYKEKRHFGPISLVRQSRTHVPFSVK